VGDTRGDNSVSGYFAEDRTTAQLTQCRVSYFIGASAENGVRKDHPALYISVGGSRVGLVCIGHLDPIGLRRSHFYRSVCAAFIVAANRVAAATSFRVSATVGAGSNIKVGTVKIGSSSKLGNVRAIAISSSSAHIEGLLIA
jgi:hypothetical protein